MKNDELDQRKTRKILVPLATLAVAAAVAVGSGADWTSTSNISASVTGGHLINSSNRDAKGVLTIEHLKPGAVATETVTLTEGTANDVDGSLKLVASNVSDTFAANDLQISIDASNGSGTGGYVPFESFATTDTLDLGNLNDGFGSATITIAVKLLGSADNGDQGKTATADLQFVTTSTQDNANTAVAWK